MDDIFGLLIVVICVGAIFGISRSPENDIASIKDKQERCREFQSEYEDLKLPSPPTDRLADRVAECKKLGVWK